MAGTTAGQLDDEHPIGEGESFKEDILDGLVKELTKKGICRRDERSASEQSAELFQRYESQLSYVPDVDDLQDTVKQLVLVTQQMERQTKAEVSPLLGTYDRVRKAILKAAGKHDDTPTYQTLQEERVWLEGRLKQQLTSAKDGIISQLQRIAEEKRATRIGMGGSIDLYSKLVDEHKERNAYYEHVGEKIKVIPRKDPNYFGLVEAKDELKRQIVDLQVAEQIAEQNIVHGKEKVDLLNNNEGVLMQLRSRLELLANATHHSLEISYTNHALSALYRDGKITMEILDSIDETAIKCSSIEKDTKDLSDILMRTSAKSEQNSYRISKIGHAIGRYKGALNLAAESKGHSLHQRAGEIMNSCGE